MPTEGVSLTAGTPPAATTPPPSAPVAPAAPGPTETGGNTAPVVVPGVALSPPTAPPAATTPPASDAWSGLHADHKPIVERKGWKTADDAIKAYTELETKFSSTRPAEAPKTVAEYDIAIVPPDNAKDIGYNDNFAKWFKQASFDNKVPVEAVKGLHDSFVKWAGEQNGAVGQAQAAAVSEQISSASNDLRKSWGEPNTPKFARSLDLTMRTINNLHPGLKDALTKRGALVEVDGKPMVADAVIIQALANVGATMYAEDTLFGSATASDNPFAAATLNVTAASQMAKADKAKAAALIRALPPGEQVRWAQTLKELGV